MEPHRLAQGVGDLAVEALGVVDLPGVEHRLEVALRPRVGPGPEQRVVAGLEPLDALVERRGFGRVLEGDVVAERVGVDRVVAAGARQGLLLAGEPHRAAVSGPVQRLDAERVACGEDEAGAVVVDDEGEHAAQAVDDVGPPVAVAGQDDLGVAEGREDLAVLADEFVAQLQVVVDLPVEDDAQAAVARVHRLVRAGDVDDREAFEAHADRRFGRIGRGLVGAAVVEQFEQIGEVRAAGVGTGSDDKTAHRSFTFLSGWSGPVSHRPRYGCSG